MRPPWTLHRRAVIAALAVLLLAVSTLVVLDGSRSHRHRSATKARTRAPAAKLTTPNSAPTQHQLMPSGTIDPPQTAVQKQIDSELAQAETPASIAAAEQATVPAPATSPAYPAIPAADRDDPTAYAIAFAAELLDTNYATQSRPALLGWAESEEAPNTLPGVPAAVAGKALVL